MSDNLPATHAPPAVHGDDDTHCSLMVFVFPAYAANKASGERFQGYRAMVSTDISQLAIDPEYRLTTMGMQIEHFDFDGRFFSLTEGFGMTPTEAIAAAVEAHGND